MPHSLWVVAGFDTCCSLTFTECEEHVCDWCGFFVVCCGLELARTEMQPAIHALRAAADSGVKNDGVVGCPASLSLPWLAKRATDRVRSNPSLYTHTK